MDYIDGKYIMENMFDIIVHKLTAKSLREPGSIK